MTEPVKHPGRPTGIGALTNAAKRLRAYELYMQGMKKAAIAETLGLSKPAISNWARKDRWDMRLQTLKERVEEQATLISQTSLAAILADMQMRLRVRLAELETLCGPANPQPSARIQAIRTWFQIVKELEALAPPKSEEIPIAAFTDDLQAANQLNPIPTGGPDSEGNPDQPTSGQPPQ